MDIVGGCCGTTPAHVKALAAAAAGRKPRRIPEDRRTLISGIDMLEVNEDNRPVLVGERTNVLGSRKFKRLIAAGEFEAAAEIARAQVKNGAQVIDVCLQDPDRDEVADVNAFLERATRMVKAPLMLDSTDANVLEIGLVWSQGKSVINSINLEDGEERFRSVVPLAQRYGAALVVGTIDEDPVHGMGVTRERKLEIARRSYTLLTEKYGIPAEDLIFDPLVFPCGTGDEKYVGSAAETIEGIRAIKAEFPQCKTILGISNVSFGLPESGREVLNSVFLYHCVKAGLDLAIVNSEKQMRYPSIPEEERRLAEDLLFNRGADPVGAFAGYFKAKGQAPKVARRARRHADRAASALHRRRHEGRARSPISRRSAREGWTRSTIINGPLMEGMREVGRLFNDNELIVAEVLQSAEAMKAAVNHLQKFMEKSASSLKGKIVLATVKGDVHDIGKNLVEIILSNNGYEVINLGIKVPSEDARRGVPRALARRDRSLGPSRQERAADGDDGAGLDGGGGRGAAARRRRGAVPAVHRQQDRAGVRRGRRLCGGRDARPRARGPRPVRRRGARGAHGGVGRKARRSPSRRGGARREPARRARRAEPLRRDPAARRPRRTSRSTSYADLSVEGIWPYVNPHMLFSKHLGLRGSYWKLKESGDPKLAELEEVVGRLRRSGWIRPRAIYRYFEAYSEGNSVHLVENGTTAGTLRVSPAGDRRAALPRRLRAAARVGRAARHSRSPRHDRRRRDPRARREAEARRGVPALPRPAGARARERRRRGGVGCTSGSARAGASRIPSRPR